MATCNLEKFYQKEDIDHDVIIYVGDPPNVISFSLHSEVLKSRSKYFQVALSSEWVRKQDDRIMLTIPTISPEVFNFLLNHIYTDKLIFEGAPTDGKSCLNRIVAADELNLNQLSLYEQKFLITNRSEWLRNNFLLVYKIITTLPTLDLLRDFCLKLLCEEPSLLLNYQTIHLVDESTFSILLKMDALQMTEISIWDTVIEWGISKVPYLSESNIEDWTQDDWELLKSSLVNIIPLVRFEHISKRDLYKYVKPFTEILPKDILSKLPTHEYDKNVDNVDNNVDNNVDDNEKNLDNVEIITTSKRFQLIDSTIITISHLPQISDWIKGKSCGEFPKAYDFNFSLILRASRDGYSPNTFHRWCDDYGAPTLILIKLKDSCQIIGGYNCFSWKSPMVFSTTQHDEHAFIFSLCDKDGDRENAKVARPKRMKKKCYNNNNNNNNKVNFMKTAKNHFITPGPSLKFSRFCGPCFGKSDLQLQNRLAYCKQRDYDDNITDQSGLFEIDDYEIFRVEICQKYY
ncbi:kelch-like protein 17 [Gigaspora margarita]|uniref:Kelch-like protein 17 n=1 Tax=Gigaspora margarita TaxID=4874 RepID=A0A8H3X897_GIGMA|nr:kelch-like protein 17 [Gigaspora margarita]